MNYKVVLGFVAGLLTGAAATFFITKKIHEDEIEQLKEERKNKAGGGDREWLRFRCLWGYTLSGQG